MDISYKEKYHKYKLKYLELKNNQIGGDRSRTRSTSININNSDKNRDPISKIRLDEIDSNNIIKVNKNSYDIESIYDWVVRMGKTKDIYNNLIKPTDIIKIIENIGNSKILNKNLERKTILRTIKNNKNELKDNLLLEDLPDRKSVV